jgi:hypothetical protein
MAQNTSGLIYPQTPLGSPFTINEQREHIDARTREDELREPYHQFYRPMSVREPDNPAALLKGFNCLTEPRNQQIKRNITLAVREKCQNAEWVIHTGRKRGTTDTCEYSG